MSIEQHPDYELYKDIIERWQPYGFSCFKIMPNGNLAAIGALMFTFGLYRKLDWVNASDRWCYETLLDAKLALHLWNGEGDPCGPWLKHMDKALTDRQRYNPLLWREKERDIFERIPVAELDICKIWPRGLPGGT